MGVCCFRALSNREHYFVRQLLVSVEDCLVPPSVKKVDLFLFYLLLFSFKIDECLSSVSSYQG